MWLSIEASECFMAEEGRDIVGRTGVIFDERMSLRTHLLMSPMLFSCYSPL